MLSLPGYSHYLFGARDSNGLATASNISAVYWWDANAGAYAQYIQGNKGNNLAKIAPCMGIWVKAKYNMTLTFDSGVDMTSKESAKAKDGSGVDVTPPTISW